MKKVLLVLFAIVAVAGTTEAKSISKTPVGCWSYKEVSEPISYIEEGEMQDTLVTFYRTDFDSLMLCPKGIGILQYRVTRRFVYTTEEGYEKTKQTVDEYAVRFRWKYKKGKVCMLSYYPNISCTHVERTSDNRGTKLPSNYNNTFDEEAAEYMIDLLPQLGLEYTPKTGRLYSHGYRSPFRRCQGNPAIPTSRVTVI